MPAHWPRHRGSGGKWANPWHPLLWVPLCYDCHELIDGRLGITSAARKKAYEDARDRLTLLAQEYWERLGGAA